MIWLLIGYMWLFIHRPFEVWPWMTQYRPERIYVMFTVACWLVSGPKLPKWNRLHGYFAVFSTILAISHILSPYQELSWDTTESYLKLVVFYVLLVTTVRTKHDLRTILLGYACVMALFMAHSLREFYLGRAFYLQGISRLRGVNVTFGDQNYFGGLIGMSLPIGCVLWHEWSGRIARAAVLAYVGLSFWCIIKTGSRMAFAGLLFAGLLAAISSPKRWRILALSPAVAVGAWMLIPESQQSRYLTLVGVRTPQTRASDESDYRYWGFQWGLDLCAQRPLFGHGPGTTRLAHPSGRPGHNTYGEVLGELGILGTVAFGVVLFGVGQNFLEARCIVRSAAMMDDLLPWHTVAAASAAFLLTAFMAWGLHYLYYYVWLWFGAFQTLGLQCLKDDAESGSLEDSILESDTLALESEP